MEIFAGRYRNTLVMVYSTYQDVFYKTTADTMEYVIKQGDTYIFRGIAIKAPGADYAYIDVGKICRQYLENNLPDFRDFNDEITRLPNAFQKFTLSSVYHNIIWTGVETYLDDVTEQVEEIYRFLFNWDYERTAADNEGMPLSDPVNGHMDCRMKLIYTQYGETVGSDFYVTPLLSSPVMGATLTAKITTDYDDLQKLSIVVGNTGVTVQDYDLHSATFVTPANEGETVSTTAYYYYDGELVGKTEIILAGEQGGDPEDTDTTIVVDGGKGQIPGTALYRGWEPLKDYIVRIPGSTSGSTLFTVSGSDYITGLTGTVDTVDLLYLVLIDDNTPAPLGDKVKVSITTNNVSIRKEYTVTVRWNGLYGDGGVMDYRLVDTFSAEASTSPSNVGSIGASWGNEFYNNLRIQIGGDYGGYWLSGEVTSKHYCTATGNTVYSSMVIRFMNIYEQLMTDNSAHFSSVTINSTVTSLKFEKFLNTSETVTTSGVTDLYYNGTLAQWNSLENVDLNTWSAYNRAGYVKRSLNPRKLKTFSYYPTEGNVGVTALTVHCSDGVTEWTTLPYYTGETIETYIDKIQIPGSEQASYIMQLKIETDKDLNGVEFFGSDEYFTISNTGRELRWDLSGGNAPLGHTFSGKLITGWTYVGDIDFEVTSIFANTGDTVATQKTINETVGITASPVEVGVGASAVRLRYNNPPYAGTYVGCTISFNTLLTESALTENYRQSIETASTDGSITVSKSAKNNTLNINANNNLTENVTVTLNASGYVGYYVSDVASNYGVTDIYIADTVEWFSGLPSVKSINSSGFNTIKSRWYKGVAGKSITVHCSNGTFTWSPDETV